MPPPPDILSLVQAHQAGIWRHLRFLGCAPDEADYLTQETFLSVLARPFEDRGPQAAAAYLRTVARNLLLNRRRRPGAFASLEDMQDAEEAWTSRIHDDTGEEYLQALRDCLETLSARARQALELQYRDGLSRTRIAEAVAVSEEGAKSLLQRSKEALRGCVESKVKHG